MKLISVTKSIYKHPDSGRFYYRPFIRGKRTTLRLYGKSLAEAKKEYAQFVKAKTVQKMRKQMLDVVNEPAGDLTNIPSCLYKYAHMVRVFYPPKKERGLYFLMDGKECVYVGQSIRSVLVRIAEHGLDKIFDKVFYIPFDGELDTPERHFIALLKPKHNSKDIDGFVEEPFATKTQMKYRREKTREKIIKACMKCGDSLEEATRKAKYLLKGKNFDPDLLSDELPTGQPIKTITPAAL